jgi:molybdopterin-guanine dinucleotide biosynthesis adapter protein
VALVKPVVFQVVGYQNSGKTTYTLKLIQRLKNLGITTATIKHHGHGGKPDVKEGKDSVKHLEAGAGISIVEGGGRLILQAEGTEASLEEQIKLLGIFQPNVILVEGYKHKPYPKVLLIRNQTDLQLLDEVTNVKAIVYWQEETKASIEANVPCFVINDDNSVDWIVKILKNCVEEEG